MTYYYYYTWPSTSVSQVNFEMKWSNLRWWKWKLVLDFLQKMGDKTDWCWTFYNRSECAKTPKESMWQRWYLWPIMTWLHNETTPLIWDHYLSYSNKVGLQNLGRVRVMLLRFGSSSVFIYLIHNQLLFQLDTFLVSVFGYPTAPLLFILWLYRKTHLIPFVISMYVT